MKLSYDQRVALRLLANRGSIRPKKGADEILDSLVDKGLAFKLIDVVVRHLPIITYYVTRKGQETADADGKGIPRS